MGTLGVEPPKFPAVPPLQERRSLSPTDFGVSAQSNATRIAPIDEGDSRVSVEFKGAYETVNRSLYLLPFGHKLGDRTARISDRLTLT